MADKLSPRPPPSVSIGRQLDKEKIDVLSKRVENLVSSNNSLRTTAERNEKDTHDIVLYFQREMEIKDDIISRLNEELIKKESQMRVECDKLRQRFEDEFLEYKKERNDLIDDLKLKLSYAENELSNLDSFRRDKEYHDRKLATIESTYAQEKADAMFAYDEQERKFMESKAHLLKELEDQKATFRANAMKEAREHMDLESKRLVVENRRLSEELKFHATLSREAQNEKTKLETALQVAKREISLLSEKDEENAKQGHYKSKEIKILRERVEELEKAQILSLERFKSKTKEMKTSIQKELEDVTMDATGLRRLLQVKNKELQHMKALAATILSQRSEMEKFLLDSLSEVQEIVRQERRKLKTDTNHQIYNQMRAEGVRNSIKGRGPSFPRIKPNHLHHLETRGGGPSNLPTKDDEKIFVKDLTWEDKEMVLRLLFSKLNSQQNNVTSVVKQSNSPQRQSRHDYQPAFISEGHGIEEFVEDASKLSYESSFVLAPLEDETGGMGISPRLTKRNSTGNVADRGFDFSDDIFGAQTELV